LNPLLWLAKFSDKSKNNGLELLDRSPQSWVRAISYVNFLVNRFLHPARKEVTNILTCSHYSPITVLHIGLCTRAFKLKSESAALTKLSISFHTFEKHK